MQISEVEIPSKKGFTVALTDTFIKTIKHTGEKLCNKHADGTGLYLHVTLTGKYWRMNYRFNGKQKTIAFGVYPDVSLAKARERLNEARKLLADKKDPSAAKQADKQATAVAASNTFELVAREFHKSKSDSWSGGYAAKWMRGLEKDLFPYIGALPLPTITAPILLEALRRVEKRGVHETAHTLRQSAGQVFMYGVQTGRCERSPALDLHGALKPVIVTNMAAILDPHKVGELMRAIDGYSGQPATRAALALSSLLFQRPGNIRQMEWAWINFDDAMLTIPSQDMKRRVCQKINGRPHLVPLAPQALAFLVELRPLTRLLKDRELNVCKESSRKANKACDNLKVR